jgi:hypothetical protein
MDSPAPVTPPDPVATAAAQTASNKATAISQAELNNYDKVGPDGSMTYKQIGTNADGTPQFQQTTALSDSNQGIYDTNQRTKQNIATIGADQSAKIGALLGTPYNVDNAIATKIDQLGAQRLDPQWAANEATFKANMANSGIQEGSQAYDNAYRNFSQSKNDAYNSLYLHGDAQANSESLAQRNQPINEISALMSGSQVATPNFAASPTTSVAGTDVAGITQNSYLDANQQAQQAVAGNNATMGGLFGLAGTVGSAAAKAYVGSDRELKMDIARVGILDNGLPVYRYRYKAGGPFHIGLMADEVLRVRPEAVATLENGFKAVRYDLATQGAA